MHPLVRSRLSDIERLCREHHVRRLEVFGSAARATDFDEASSDVDFLVEFEAAARKPWMGEHQDLQAALADLLERPVDLVSAAPSGNPYIDRTINEDRTLIYAS